MSRAILLYMTIFISVAFMFIPEGPRIKILLWARPHISENVAYHLFEHLQKILVFYVIYELTRLIRWMIEKYKITEVKMGFDRFFLFMLCYQVVDMIDAIITYNDVWFRVGIPITMNVVASLVGLIILIKDYGKS